MNAFIQFIKTKFWFFVTFVCTKGIVYLAPLILAEILTKEDFGILEYALAGLGMVVNAFINLGVPSAYPYFKLKSSETNLDNAFNLHYLWLLFFIIIAQLLFYTLQFNISYLIALNVAYVVSNQVFISIQLKTNERIVSAVIFDSGVYIVLLLFAILFYFKMVSASITTISSVVQVYALIYVVNAIYRCSQIDFNTVFRNYLKILKYSIHVLVGSLLIYFITVSGRILIEFFLKDYELVGIYAFYFRLSAVVVMVYQVINIAFFKKMYQLNPKILDHYFSICFGVLYIISIGAFIITPFVMPLFSEFYKDTIHTYKPVYFLLVVQMIFWIATALFSNIIDREKLASKNNPLFLILLIVFISTLLGLQKTLDLKLFVLIHLLVVFLAGVIQMVSLYRKKINFKKSFVTLLAINLLSLGVYFFI